MKVVCVNIKDKLLLSKHAVSMFFHELELRYHNVS